MRRISAALSVIISCGFLFTGCGSFAQKTADSNSSENSPVVRTASGLVRGLTEGDVSSFKGIPYAAAPVGEYRWRPPQPVIPWEGIREAKEFAEIQTRFNTDKAWAEPARFTAGVFAANGDPSYIFLFSYVPAAMKERMRYGPGHGSDIPFVFGNLRVPEGAAVAAEDKEVARIMNTCWVNFARSGNPNGKDLPEWPVYSSGRNEILDIQPGGKPAGKPDPRKARLDVIEKAVNMGDKLQPNGI